MRTVPIGRRNNRPGGITCEADIFPAGKSRLKRLFRTFAPFEEKAKEK